MNVKTDELIRDDVNAELRWENRLKGAEIGVIVSKGIVTLTGTVTSYAQKLAAQDAAHNVDGVAASVQCRGLSTTPSKREDAL